MGSDDFSATIIQGSGEEKAYEKGVLSFQDEDREVKILWTTEIILGREDICDICLPDNRISRKHAVLQLEYDAVKLVDLMSSNGTTRNGEKVDGTIILNNGDKLMLGGAISIDVKLREKDEVVKSVALKIANTEYLLTQTEVLIGRDHDATDITVDDLSMSKVHAQLEFLFDVPILSSLDIDKPLLINEEETNSSQIKNLFAIQIGNTRLVWRS